MYAPNPRKKPSMSLYCTVCRNRWPETRVVRGAPHRSPECRSAYRRWRRDSLAERRCRLCGRPKRNREVPPRRLQRCMTSEAEPIIATGMPLGLFYASTYEVKLIQLAPGEKLLFCTDGVTEARNRSDSEYGHECLAHLATGQRHLRPKELVKACRNDVSAFTSSAHLSDDLTLLALRRR
jgi:hypothetical protein